MQRSRSLAGLASLALLIVLSGPAAAMTQQEAAEKIAEEYGVEVLKTDALLQDGRAVILLTVMQPGSDDNAAFQVNTIAVDAKTGELIPGFRRMETGSVTSNGASASTIENRRPSSARSGGIWR
ncbi:MAG: hypothetical protein WD489_04030 [Rhodovibrionaceae bacterium]